MKQSNDKPQTQPQQQAEQSAGTKDAKKLPGSKAAAVDEGPVTQWPGPLDRPLSFSER